MAGFFDLMETKGWIHSLECAADAIHVQGPSGAETVRSKRQVDDGDDGALKENRNPAAQRKAKKAKVDKGVLKGRPMLQDVINDVS